MSSTTVSSSGKVLLAGGYLVLDPAHSGLVVSTSSRFYTHIRPANGSPSTIVVRSPQFENATWAYAVHSAPTGVQIDQTNSEAGSNKFVHLALQRTFQLAAEIRSPEQISAALQNGLDVAIVGDNDFYSQRATLAKQGLPPLLSSLNRLPPFGKTGVSLREVHKTGLGSSAALITSLITALLIHLEIVSRASFSGTAASSEAAEKTSKDRNLAHNLSQYVHCLAQGKVGSGFDVAAAVFGSQIYTRFDPAVLSPLMVDELTPGTRLLDVLSPDNTKWNHRVRPFKLPPNVRLMLADVDAGSDTPSLVGKVLKWRESHKDQADELWSTLDRSNQTLATALNQLTDLSKQDGNVYAAAITHISSLPAGQWRSTSNENTDLATVVTAFADAHDAAQTIREKMRGMGERAGVPIEPREQTALLDACIGQEGVIGGGVPGAGGYDAVWVLVAAEGEGATGEGLRGPVGRVESVWSSWKELDVSPLSAQESSGGVGCRLEDVERVKGLKAALEV